MSITIDLKMVLLIIVSIAIIVLAIYLVRCLKRLMITLEHTNAVLKDVQEITDIAAKRSRDVDGIISNVSETISEITDTINGKQNIIATIAAVVKAVAALKNTVDEKKK